MNIDFENEMLMFCLKKYDGTTEDGREFSIIARNDGYSTWIEDIEYEDDFSGSRFAVSVCCNTV